MAFTVNYDPFKAPEQSYRVKQLEEEFGAITDGYLSVQPITESCAAKDADKFFIPIKTVNVVSGVRVVNKCECPKSHETLVDANSTFITCSCPEGMGGRGCATPLCPGKQNADGTWTLCGGRARGRCVSRQCRCEEDKSSGKRF